MPAYFPPPLQRQLPLTPPEYFDEHNFDVMASQQGYCAGPNDRHYAYDYSEGYPIAKQAQFTTMTGPQFSYERELERQAARYSVPPPREHSFGPIAAPILPPIRVADKMDVSSAYSQPTQSKQAAVPPKEEKSAGGVAAHLDYEMDRMVDFVAEMSQGMYDLLKSRFCLADIDLSRSVQPTSPAQASFRKYVSQILASTRLPKATILLALHYLSTRMTMLSEHGTYSASTGHPWRLLTSALMLASKFLDDNTFQNKSWAEVSRIPVAELNAHEMEWLCAINWHLHVDWTDQAGLPVWFNQWDHCMERYEARKAELSLATLKLTPIDTVLQRQYHAPQQYTVPQLANPLYMPPTPFTPNYDSSSCYMSTDTSSRTPPHWNQWPQIRSLSPASANPTGPNTPEWYGKSAGSAYPQSNMAMSRNLPPPHILSSQQSPMYPGYQNQYPGHLWPMHSAGCACSYCYDRYGMHHGYGMQAVMG